MSGDGGRDYSGMRGMMKTPERIYLHRDRLGAVTWETEPDNNAIEYIRRDVAVKLRAALGDAIAELKLRDLPGYDIYDETTWLAEPTPAKEEEISNEKDISCKG